MPPSLADIISPEQALIFRITHVRNVPFLLANGVHCRSSANVDPEFVEIGNSGIISKRKSRPIEIPPGGTLSDFVPFYFTPKSPMLYNILTGYGGLSRKAAGEIVILLSSLDKLEELQLPYLIADRNATLAHATLSSGRAALPSLRWKNWQTVDFKRDQNDLGKMEQYQAEVLVHACLPTAALHAIIAHDSSTQAVVAQAVSDAGLTIPARVRSNWYF